MWKFNSWNTATTVEQNFILDSLTGLVDQYEKVGGAFISLEGVLNSNSTVVIQIG